MTLLQSIERGSARLLSTYQLARLACSNGFSRGGAVFDPDTGYLIVLLPLLDEGALSPEQQQLIDLIAFLTLCW